LRLESRLEMPKKMPDQPAKVTGVYPSSDQLPENLLRFYIHFASPMRRGEAYTHIRLLNENGTAIASPFLEISEKLWDTSGERLTVLINPGRIKRGLKPREDLGPVLEAGKSYSLVIDADWRDADGQTLSGSLRKQFKTIPPIENGIDPAKWSIESPQA